jgi:hypothetical protein
VPSGQLSRFVELFAPKLDTDAVILRMNPGFSPGAVT